MKTNSPSLITLSLFSLLSVNAIGAPAVLRQDPVTEQKYFMHESDWNSEHEGRLDIGWTVPEYMADEIDFPKIAAGDESYLASIEQKLDASAINVLVDTKTGKIVTELYELNQAIDACIWYTDRGCNHTSIYAKYSEKDKLATLVGAGKWDTRYISLALISEDASGLKIRAKTKNLMPILENDVTVALDKSQNNNKAYRRDRDRLAFSADDNLQVTLNETNSAGTTSIKFNITVNAYVPKGMEDDSFDTTQTLSYLTNARAGYESLAVEKIK
jgi:hypothetical protein